MGLRTSAGDIKRGVLKKKKNYIVQIPEGSENVRSGAQLPKRKLITDGRPRKQIFETSNGLLLRGSLVVLLV